MDRFGSFGIGVIVLTVTATLWGPALYGECVDARGNTTDMNCPSDNGPLNSQSNNLAQLTSSLATNELANAPINPNGCAGMMGSKPEQEFLNKLDSINEQFFDGKITSAQYSQEKADTLTQYNPKTTPSLEKLLAIGNAGVTQQSVMAHLSLAAMDVAGGHPVSAATQQRLATASGLSVDQVNEAIQKIAAPLQGYARALKAAGASYNGSSQSWDLTKARFNVHDLQSSSGSTLKTALGLFISPAAMKQITDTLRTAPIPFPGPNGQKLVILPPLKFPGSTGEANAGKQGDIRIVTQAQYQKQMASALDQYKDARTKFLQDSKQSTSMWDQVKLAVKNGPGLEACWGDDCIGPGAHKAWTKQTSAEADKNQQYQKLSTAEHSIMNLGAPKQQLLALNQDMGNVIKVDSANIDVMTAKLNAGLKAATSAQTALAVTAVTAGVGAVAGAAAGVGEGVEAVNSMRALAVAARLATNAVDGAIAMSKFPLLLSGATMGYDAGIDTWKNGGSFLCNLAENVAEQGPGAVKSAIDFGMMGAGGVALGEATSIGAKVFAGADSAKAVQVGSKVAAQAQNGINLYFSGTTISQGVGSAKQCGSAVMADLHNNDPQSQAAVSSTAWKTCGQTGIDAYFAVTTAHQALANAGSGFQSGDSVGTGVLQAGKALLMGAPAVADVAKVDVTHPESIQASISKMSANGATTADLKPLADRMAKGTSPKDLVNLLGSQDPQVSMTAQMALEQKSDPQSAQLLIKMAEKPNSKVNTALTKTIGAAEAQRVAQLASSSMAAKDVLMERALKGDPTAQKYLLKMASSKDPVTSEPAMEKAKWLSTSEQFTATLKKGLKDNTTQATAAELLASFSSREANDAVRALLGGPSIARAGLMGSETPTPDTIHAAIQGLQGRGDAIGQALLEDAASSKDPLESALAKTAIAERDRSPDAEPGSQMAVLSRAEKVALGKYQLQSARDRKASGAYAVGDVVQDEQTGARYHLVNRGVDRQGAYYVAVDDQGRTKWFTDDDLKNGKSYVKVVNTRDIAGARSDSPAKVTKAAETEAQMEKTVTTGLTAMADKVNFHDKYGLGADNQVIIERVVKGLKPREIEELNMRLKDNPEKVQRLLGDAFKQCGGQGAGAVSRTDWDPVGTFAGILYGPGENSCEI